MKKKESKETKDCDMWEREVVKGPKTTRWISGLSISKNQRFRNFKLERNNFQLEAFKRSKNGYLLHTYSYFIMNMENPSIIAEFAKASVRNGGMKKGV